MHAEKDEPKNAQFNERHFSQLPFGSRSLYEELRRERKCGPPPLFVHQRPLTAQTPPPHPPPTSNNHTKSHPARASPPSSAKSHSPQPSAKMHQTSHPFRFPCCAPRPGASRRF